MTNELDALINTVQCCDALALMEQLPPASIDAIITDLPYGTTACSWDEIIPFEPMWAGVKRVLKPRGVFVTTASQPFTSKLVMSNPEWFRCEWVVKKPAGTGYLNANRQPMKNHESIIVFAAGAHNYYPIMRTGKPYRATRGAVGGFVRDKTVGGYLTINNGDRYPLSVINSSWATAGLHPTEKPVDLIEYLILTYTMVDDLILDFSSGSGTTGVAARNLNRRYILNDNSPEYVGISLKRLALPYTVNMFETLPPSE